MFVTVLLNNANSWIVFVASDMNTCSCNPCQNGGRYSTDQMLTTPASALVRRDSAGNIAKTVRWDEIKYMLLTSSLHLHRCCHHRRRCHRRLHQNPRYILGNLRCPIVYHEICPFPKTIPTPKSSLVPLINSSPPSFFLIRAMHSSHGQIKCCINFI